MEMNYYQTEAEKTAIYPSEHGLTYLTLGLVGEAGEVAETLKKVIRDSNGDWSLDQLHATAKELGDVFWYLANLAGGLGYSLEEIAEMNIAKLRDRQERGKLGGSGDNR